MNSSILTTSEKAYSYLDNTNWTLCLGAGICKGILPDWFDLTRNVVNEIFNFNWSENDFKENIDKIGFSLDSWLQAALNKNLKDGNTIDDFNFILEKNLYQNIIRKAEDYRLGEALAVMIHNPHWIKKKESIGIVEFFEKEYSNSTLIQLKNILLDSDDKLTRPESIITFNADPLLHSLVVIFGVYNHYKKTGEYNYPQEDYVRVTRPFETGREKKIPILHLHGAIYPQIPVDRKIKNDSRDNLIFAESSYSKAAATMSGWAQNVFSYTATNSKMIFLGLSMSDPNIRKWLNWSTENINNQLDSFKGDDNNKIIKHIWIQPKPINESTQKFLENSLIHLGTKPGWINSWQDVEKGILNLMGKKTKSNNG
ncbi:MULTISPECIES: SIR2 family protein [Mesonia]|uniref:Uncharacterized protein n=1 Tax=Mesonia oceanica TaxID=2687242 RepID=A0AC61Y7L1_9FLAO|nr:MULTISPECIES: SIR2 family protein [Mesonia]VVV00452.1 hypothetical protein FVB9532_01723 [Mesonia oceanica]